MFSEKSLRMTRTATTPGGRSPTWSGNPDIPPASGAVPGGGVGEVDSTGGGATAGDCARASNGTPPVSITAARTMRTFTFRISMSRDELSGRDDERIEAFAAGRAEVRIPGARAAALQAEEHDARHPPPIRRGRRR